jgi:hypothetical protein
MRPRCFAAIVLTSVVLSGVAVVAQPVDAQRVTVPKRIAKMNGDKVVPGPGDGNGKGRSVIRPNVQRSRVCFNVKWKRIQDPIGGYIHKGAAGEKGPKKLIMFEGKGPFPGPTLEGCLNGVKKKLVRKLKAHPRLYYINVVNENFPDGAIRGQLERP